MSRVAALCCLCFQPGFHVNSRLRSQGKARDKKEDTQVGDVGVEGGKNLDDRVWHQIDHLWGERERWGQDHGFCLGFLAWRHSSAAQLAESSGNWRCI